MIVYANIGLILIGFQVPQPDVVVLRTVYILYVL